MKVRQCFALGVVLCVLLQSANQLPITIEVEQEVDVQHNADPSGKEQRGTLYLYEAKSEDFQLKKSQQFQIVATGLAGSCRIRFHKKLFGISSCPWVDGFTDHQADIFRIVRGSVKYTIPEKSK
jgi:hypothetical protein